MVDVNDQEPGQQEEFLRARVHKLTGELDHMDGLVASLRKVYAEVVTTLAGLMGYELGPAQVGALEKLNRIASSNKVAPLELGNALQDFKTALLAAGPLERCMVAQEELAVSTMPPGEESDLQNAGRHLALALLEGLRLGDPTFDAELERGLAVISQLMAQGRLREVLVRATDLLDAHRQAQEEKARQAEQALMEVVNEVVKTQDVLVQAFQDAQDNLAQAGNEYDQGVKNSVVALARDIHESKDLDHLKTRALDHLRAIRAKVRERQAKESALLGATRRQLTQVRDKLGEMRERVRMAERLSHEFSQQAMSDPLTGLWNKRALTARLKATLNDPTLGPISLIIFDVDNFKGVNDSYGHQAGDKALQTIAERAAETLRRQDELFRYAGDEFVVLLYGTDKALAVEVAERVRQACQTIRFTYRGQGDLHMTVSMGVAQAEADDDPESLFYRADQALLAAKQAGRNRVNAP